MYYIPIFSQQLEQPVGQAAPEVKMIQDENSQVDQERPDCSGRENLAKPECSQNVDTSPETSAHLKASNKQSLVTQIRAEKKRVNLSLT